MTRRSYSFLDYLSSAFQAAPTIPGLGAIPVNKLFLAGVGLLGFANPGFWFIGGAVELSYLWFLSTNPRFQKYVQSLDMKTVQIDKTAKLNAMVETLDNKSRERLGQLNLHLAEINRLMGMNANGTFQFAREAKQKTLSQLPIVYLKLLVTRSLTKESLQRSDMSKIRNEIASLEAQLKDTQITEALANSIQGTLEIQHRRLDNLQRAKDNLKLIEMELNRIDNQVELVREEIALDQSPEGLSSNIDRIHATLGETEAWMNTHSEFFHRLDAEEEHIEPVMPPPMEME